MTALAVATKTPVVDIILAMATVAAGCNREPVAHRVAVTGLALDALMPPIQPEIRAGIMVEFPQ